MHDDIVTADVVFYVFNVVNVTAYVVVVLTCFLTV